MIFYYLVIELYGVRQVHFVDSASPTEITA